MNIKELDIIKGQILNLKNLPNTELLRKLDFLSEEFEKTKNNIIELTYYLDKTEELYNIITKEIDNRK